MSVNLSTSRWGGNNRNRMSIRKTTKGRKLVAKDPARLRTEHEEQSLYFTWVKTSMEMQTNPRLRGALRWTHAIPNGYHKSMNMRMKAMREGVTSGILDVLVPCPELGRRSADYHALYIEFKRTGNKPTPNQVEFMTYLDLVHWKHTLAFFWQQAARATVDFLGLETYAEITEIEWLKMKAEAKQLKRAA